ncbi:MAG: Hsp70 family protein [Pedobacter sp.]|nr:MAG: Hsp70 family protein [Pedobacter sp.]
MENINFGIDLGTTNSGIGKFEDGKVRIYKNPVGFRDTLPSVIAYRNSRVLIGDKARELTTVQTENVFSSFKRKMGSDYTYYVPAVEQTKTAIDFSALILKELLNFIGDEKPAASVITIPASFDTVQSNATKQAALEAGLIEVILLQEPIAACLAYANDQNISPAETKNWIVYDFGGGTFDVALVRIDERELKVIDHEGNNFLGGLDIDNLILEHIFCPRLENVMGEDGIWKKMVNAEDSSYSRLFVELLYKAEEAKKELSLKENIVVEIELNDLGKFVELEISRTQFNDLIKLKVDETIKLTKLLLEKNNISNEQIERIILVGGTTYIPYVKETLKSNFECLVDSSIDPTTAIIVGASYYAGTKMITADLQAIHKITKNEIEIKLVYEVNSQDAEELLTGYIPTDFCGFYRIIRKDGGFDTGMMPFRSRFNEFLKLIPKTTNTFNVRIFDQNQEIVFEKNEISINQGIYNISGQPLPNDICLEVDDAIGGTFLEKIFRKNDILPLTKKIYKTISKTILKDSEDKLVINIIEGRAETSPASNLCIGYLEINATNLPFNLLKGTDIEIDFEISESRDLTIGVYISSINLEITQVFNASSRQVSIAKVKMELERSLINIDYEIQESVYNEAVNKVDRLERIRIELIELLKELIDIEDDLVTDRIYNIDERKRKAFQELDSLVLLKNVLADIEEYQAYKQEIKEALLLKPNPKIEHAFNLAIRNEQQILGSNQTSVIKSKTKELQKITRELYYQNDDAYVNLFYEYSYLEPSAYENEKQVKKLIANGEKAIKDADYVKLKAIISNLYSLLKVKPKDHLEDKSGTLGLR